MNCPDCGAEMDDFSECACAFAKGDRILKPKRTQTRYDPNFMIGGGMRAMVARKLEKKKATGGA
jgi:hypothetical protein